MAFGKDFIFLVENFPKFELKGLGEKNCKCLEMFGNYCGDGVIWCVYIYIVCIHIRLCICINAN